MKEVVLFLSNIGNTATGISEMSCALSLVYAVFFLARFHKRYTWSSVFCLYAMVVVDIMYLMFDTRLDMVMAKGKLLFDPMMMGTMRIVESMFFSIFILLTVELHNRANKDIKRRISTVLDDAFKSGDTMSILNEEDMTESKSSLLRINNTIRVKLRDVDEYIVKKWEKSTIFFINMFGVTLFILDTALLAWLLFFYRF